MSEQVKKSEQPFEHLIRALQEGESRRISQCIEQIDHRLIDCRKSLEEYRRVRDSLRLINTELSKLGQQPLSVEEDDLPGHDLSEIIKWRIDHFKSKGKL
ncbi:MAG TPA: hypothetical protein VIE90_19550 [Candidatus Binatia bacterium]|jgi:hypothetical protein